MSTPPPPVVFDDSRAVHYDTRAAFMAPVINGLHHLIGLTFSELPENARILCVGAGTGLEIGALAAAHPGWHFTAVEPAPAMLQVCKNRVASLGLADRCTFHEGYLDTLPEGEPYDGATSLLVSHFIMAKEERTAYFREIARRLCAGGRLVSSDISTDLTAAEFEPLMELWFKMLFQSGVTPEEAANYRAIFGTAVAVLPPSEVAGIIEAGGFHPPALIFQALLIHAWSAVK